VERPMDAGHFDKWHVCLHAFEKKIQRLWTFLRLLWTSIRLPIGPLVGMALASIVFCLHAFEKKIQQLWTFQRLLWASITLLIGPFVGMALASIVFVIPLQVPELYRALVDDHSPHFHLVCCIFPWMDRANYCAISASV
jgi:hypothetical protein